MTTTLYCQQNLKQVGTYHVLAQYLRDQQCYLRLVHEKLLQEYLPKM